MQFHTIDFTVLYLTAMGAEHALTVGRVRTWVYRKKTLRVGTAPDGRALYDLPGLVDRAKRSDLFGGPACE